eukprot:UN26187
MGAQKNSVTIPSVFVTSDTYEILIENVGEYATLNGEGEEQIIFGWPLNTDMLLLLFIVSISFCVCVVAKSFAVKRWQKYQRNQRASVIPRVKYTDGLEVHN